MKALEETFENQDNFPSVSFRQPLWQIWKLMKQLGRSILPVVDEGQLVGVVRDKELSLLNNLNAGSLDIREVMNTDPCCVYLEDSLAQVIEIVAQGEFEYVVVLNGREEIIEILSLNRLLAALYPHCPSEKLGKISSII